MALKHPSTPSAVALAYLGGLGLTFLGERVFAATPSARWVLTGAGVGLLAAYAAIRWTAVLSSTEDRKRVDRLLAVLATVTLAALGVELLTTDAGLRLLHLAEASVRTRDRFESIATVTWITLVAITAIPVALAELALYPMRRSERIEAGRVLAAIATGATLGMAAAYGALLTYTAGELEVKVDYSYFKTSEPSESTRNIVNNMGEPVKVLAFFPALNDVGREVWGYLRDLARRSPKLTVEMHDRLLEPQLAKDNKVTQDGVLVLLKGPALETLPIGADMDKTRAKLKTLDQDFQKALLKVGRPPKIAYLTTGHGELNEASAATAEGRSASGAKKLLESQNFSVRDLGLEQGLGAEIPKDATVVFVLGPTRGFLPGELGALKAYAQSGGHLLLALDPDAKVDLAPLAETVGLELLPGVLANDRLHLARRYNDSDKTILVTNRYSSHASISTLSRNASHAPVVFPGAGAFDRKAGADSSLKIDFTVKSMSDSYLDTNGDFTMQPSEKKATYNIAAAISKPGPAGEKDAKELRAFALADADGISDLALANEPNMVLFLDAIRWLGGEESFSGAVSSSEDVKIEHTKQKDLVWFYGTIALVPSAVLALGLLYSRRRTGRRTARSAPTEARVA